MRKLAKIRVLKVAKEAKEAGLRRVSRFLLKVAEELSEEQKKFLERVGIPDPKKDTEDRRKRTKEFFKDFPRFLAEERAAFKYNAEIIVSKLKSDYFRNLVSKEDSATRGKVGETQEKFLKILKQIEEAYGVCVKALKEGGEVRISALKTAYEKEFDPRPDLKRMQMVAENFDDDCEKEIKISEKKSDLLRRFVKPEDFDVYLKANNPSKNRFSEAFEEMRGLYLELAKTAKNFANLLNPIFDGDDLDAALSKGIDRKKSLERALEGEKEAVKESPESIKKAQESVLRKRERVRRGETDW